MPTPSENTGPLQLPLLAFTVAAVTCGVKDAPHWLTAAFLFGVAVCLGGILRAVSR